MMPVRIWLITVMTTEFTEAKGNLTSSIGANILIALVASITNNVPIRSWMSQSLVPTPQDEDDPSDLPDTNEVPEIKENELAQIG
ncbi:hypothetical protein N7533_012917 [Penicillium manginii]|uniref:uncharacterized protein n=1 Tax=Penicillium manginii TaxID=203109 RepID=UPI00254950AA|nr:uncharacterized protein N7533_012917 [Penicillium manginii]KAJ5734514.1 hypothetical protein N7533_012917 [Penicillium manginii]